MENQIAKRSEERALTFSRTSEYPAGLAGEVMRSLQDRKLKTLDRVFAFNKYRDFLRRVIALTGTTDSQVPGDVMKEEIFNSFLKYWGGLSFAEMNLAFDMAMNKVFEVETNHFGNINPAYFSVIFKGWIKFKPSLLKELPKSSEEKPEPTEEEKQKIIKQGLKEGFERYKKTLNIEDCHAWMYDELEEKIGLTKERKFQIFERAKELFLMAEKEKKAGNINYTIRQAEGPGVKPFAKRLSLKEYFDHLIEFDEEI